MELTLTAPDIECDACANSIKNVLGKQSGVNTVNVSVSAKTITIQFDETITNAASLTNELLEIGFPTQS